MVLQVSELDRGAGIPLGTQLAWILRSRVAARDLLPGERLPGAKEMAALAGVNVNTVRAVYARLEEEGLLDVVHGRGTFVAAEPQLGDDSVAHLAAVVSAEAQRRGVDPRAVAAALYARPSETLPAGADDAAEGERLTRRALRDEIARIERELSELQAAHPELVSEREPDSAGARLLSTTELERSRDELLARLEHTRTEVAAARQNVRERRRDELLAPRGSRSSSTAGARVGWRLT
jgi:GntR family transcriptional regulator